MPTHNLTSVVDTMRCVHPIGDLEGTVDVRPLQTCATLDNHGFAMSMILFVVESWPLQFEDVDLQMLMWNAFIRDMKEHNVQNVNFKGLITICAQTNFNAIITLFGSGDSKFLMENQECKCFDHWVQSLN
jgi:hypothetical protein